MQPEDVYRIAIKAGLDSERAIMATAIAWAESGLNPDAVGDESLADEKWGPSVGLWQIRSLRAHLGTGQERDQRKLHDPDFNAASMVKISSSGANWAPWSVFGTGKYQEYLNDVRVAVTRLPTDPLDLRGRPALVLDFGLSTYVIKTFAGKAVHVLDAGVSDRTPVVQWRALSIAGQRWYLDLCGADVYRIIAHHSGRVIDLRGPGPAGSPIQQYAWAAVDNQRWRIGEERDGTVIISSVWNPDLVLDVCEASSQDGAPLIAWHRNGGVNQRFSLVPAST